MNVSNKKEIAVLQMDGIEQLFLSLPALHGIRQSYPESKITLFVEESCVELRPYIQHIDECYVISEKKINTPAECQKQQYDILINLSYSDSGIAFSSMLNAARVLGPHLDKNKNPRFLDAWSVYFESNVGKSPLNPFHRSDLYKKIATVSDFNCEMQLQISNSQLELAKNNLSKEDHLKIGISLDQINADDIIDLVKYLDQELPATKIYLLGTIKDKSVSKKIIESLGLLSTYCVDLIGKQGNAETLAMCAALDLVISSDINLCHSAAGFGTLSVSLGKHEGHCIDSTVYSDGHLIINNIENAPYAPILKELLQFIAVSCRGVIPQVEEWKNFGHALFNVHAGKYTLHLVQRNEYTSSLPILFLGTEAEECMRSFYKLLWIHEIEGKKETIYNLDLFHESTINKLTKLLKPLEQLYELSTFGQKYCAYVKKDLVSKNYERAKQHTDKLIEIDNLIDWMADNHQELIPVINYYEVSMSQVEAENPFAVAIETTKKYLKLQEHVLILLELVQSVFKKIKSLEEITNTKEAHNGRPQN